MLPVKPLGKHAQEMLAVIFDSTHPDGRYWIPDGKIEYAKIKGESRTVFVCAPWSTGAIRTLTARGLVEKVAGSASPWARRITISGRKAWADYNLHQK